jgi:hypothetical protein
MIYVWTTQRSSLGFRLFTISLIIMSAIRGFKNFLRSNGYQPTSQLPIQSKTTTATISIQNPTLLMVIL